MLVLHDLLQFLSALGVLIVNTKTLVVNNDLRSHRLLKLVTYYSLLYVRSLILTPTACCFTYLLHTQSVLLLYLCLLPQNLYLLYNCYSVRSSVKHINAEWNIL
jgi:hypothetical protein